MVRAYLTTAAHGSHFPVMPSCYVQSGIHLPGLSRTDADITRLTCKHLIPQSCVAAEAVADKCWQRQRYYSCTFFYCCCLSNGAYIESNFPLKGANCSQKIVTAIAWRWLAAYLLEVAAKNGKIPYAGDETQRREKKEKQKSRAYITHKN